MPELKELASQYRIVTLTGPRQAGKTTLARLSFPEHGYVSLEDPDLRNLALSDPRAFLEAHPSPVIFDEIQRVPSLLSYIQTIVDSNQSKGQFILTGSHQLELSQAISQSLAGRTALLTLYPLSIAELTDAELHDNADGFMHKGFLPAVHAESLDPTRFYRNYFQTYVERDVRQMIQVKDILLFEKFMKLCAGRVGQLFIANKLANEVGVSSHTISQWLSILEASFVVYRLQPFHENIGKRLVKAHKLYFVDVGLATYLLGIETNDQLKRDPLRGNLFENMVVMELVKARSNKGLDPHLFFYRDSNDNEVDVIYQYARVYRPIEIKSAMTFQSEFLKGLEVFKRSVPDRSEKGVVIYGGDLTPELEKAKVMNFRQSAHALD
jgi:predicted AAA+ superfamily ATPase